FASPPELQVFGTDIDRAALDVARRATYPAEIASDVSAERLQRFFVETDSGFQVSTALRSKCVFAEHDVVRDPPFSKIDLASCRNLLIYLDSRAKDRVLEIVHYGLAPHGYLFLGPAESVPRDMPLFEAVNARHRIFRKKASTAALGAVYGLRGPPAGHYDVKFAPRPRPSHGRLVRQVERMLLEDLAPPSVVVDERQRVLYFVGRTNPYLGPPSGTPPTDQLLELTPKPLRHALRAALREATEHKAEARRVARVDEGSSSAVEIIAQPLRLGDEAQRLLLVTFRDVPGAAKSGLMTAPVDEAGHVLELELREARAQLESTVVELEGTNEELKDANDELLSMNEEFQSANEELQTSKEELQSMNEELRTLNQELAAKIEALDRSNADMRNLFASTDVATLFLDRDLVINR
ncbi:MAG: hypothetical protein H5U40_10980, partial [Polyangiaceae bacterium]|nr:hypothetical protein [Polyangiaceae bacterium]